MSNTIVLTCLACGKQLKLSAEINRFACAYCGNEQIVKRGNGIAYLVPAIPITQSASDLVLPRSQSDSQVASELALPRLQNDLRDLHLQKYSKKQEYDSKKRDVERTLLGDKNSEVYDLEKRAGKIKQDILIASGLGGVVLILFLFGWSVIPSAYFYCGGIILVLFVISTSIRWLRFTGVNYMKNEKLQEVANVEKEIQKQNGVFELQKQKEIEDIERNIERKHKDLAKHLKVLYPNEEDAKNAFRRITLEASSPNITRRTTSISYSDGSDREREYDNSYDNWNNDDDDREGLIEYMIRDLFSLGHPGEDTDDDD